MPPRDDTQSGCNRRIQGARQPVRYVKSTWDRISGRAKEVARAAAGKLGVKGNPPYLKSSEDEPSRMERQTDMTAEERDLDQFTDELEQLAAELQAAAAPEDDSPQGNTADARSGEDTQVEYESTHAESPEMTDGAPRAPERQPAGPPDGDQTPSADNDESVLKEIMAEAPAGESQVEPSESSTVERAGGNETSPVAEQDDPAEEPLAPRMADVEGAASEAANGSAALLDASDDNPHADTGSEIESIESAFRQATAELDVINDSIQQTVAAPDAEAALSSGEASSPRPGAQSEGWPGSSQPSDDSQTVPHLSDIRNELQSARAAVGSALERVNCLFERIESVHQEAESRLRRAKAFQEAAEKAQRASAQFVSAQAVVAEARAAFDAAQSQLDSARRDWHTAQQVSQQAASEAGE